VAALPAITGSKGSVLGVFLGVALIVVTNNSLILLGIPAAWQKVATGALLLAAIGLPLLAQSKWRLPFMSAAETTETSLSRSTSE